MGKGVAVSEENKARAASYYQRQPPQVQRVIFELLLVHFRLWRHFLFQILFEELKNGRKDICIAWSRGGGDHDVCNRPFDWKFNLLYDIVSKHSIDLDHVKTLTEDAFMARFPTVPVECKTLLYHLQASIDITEEEQKGWMKDFIVNNDLVDEL